MKYVTAYKHELHGPRHTKKKEKKRNRIVVLQ